MSGGPYRWVRDPDYAGSLAACLAIILIIRTVLEARALQEELAGYRDYNRRVPYRLILGIR